MNRKRIYLMISVMMILSIACFAYIYRTYHASHLTQTKNMSTYDKHYLMIVEDADSDFWQSVYESGLKEAKASGAYLELAGADLSESHTLEEYLDIGIAAQVDGIIICPDGSREVDARIQDAVKTGIPVVTILEDAPDTGRACYVGVNTYELGQIYGQVILDESTPDTDKVLVMQDTQEDTTNNDMILNQIKNTVSEGRRQSGTLDITAFELKKENTFDTEEVIRDLFVDEAVMPDILVCLSDVDSESASQAVVDYNQVGKVMIIGYYTSEKVLEAIKKGVITATVSLDTRNMGIYSVQALREYIDSGYTSDYVSIDLGVVDAENVADYETR